MTTTAFGTDYNREDKYDFNCAVLELVWKPLTPKENPWFADAFKNTVVFGLGFVPGVGFLLQIGFTLGWSALMTPDAFLEDLKAAVPAVAWTDGIMSESKLSVEEIRTYLPAGWVGAGSPSQLQSKLTQGSVDTTDKNPTPDIDPVGEAETFIKGEKVLANSANVPPPIVEVNL